jgi:hypothetical protein
MSRSLPGLYIEELRGTLNAYSQEIGRAGVCVDLLDAAEGGK